SRKIYDLEGEGLGAKVAQVAEGDRQVNLPKWHCLPPRDDAMEWRARRSEVGAGDLHGVEGLDVEDVEPTPSVHEHLGQALRPNDWVHHERVSPGVRDQVGVIQPVEGDRGF